MSKRKQMLNLVSTWRVSGLSQQQFCKEKGVTLGKLSYWIAHSKPKEDSGFVALKPGSVKAPDSLEIHYPNGVVVKLCRVDLTVIFVF